MTDPPPPIDDQDHGRRQALRQAAAAARAALPPPAIAALAGALCEHLLRTFPVPPAADIGFCWPIRNEPDLRPAVARWCAAGARAALPVVDEARRTLAFRTWEPASPLACDRFGIPYPQSGETIRPGCLLVPMLAFDAAGYRLGYGAGYFDRTLADWAPRPLLIGVGYELGRAADIAPQRHDVPMDWVATEAGVFKT